MCYVADDPPSLEVAVDLAKLARLCQNCILDSALCFDRDGAATFGLQG
jgi:hypothetical protein